MAVSPALSIPLLQAFDQLRSMLGNPMVYAFPWQTPAGLTYDSDVDAWVAADNSVPDPDLYSLDYTAVPALWGADAEGLALTLGGVSASGDMVAIARAQYGEALAGAFMIRAGAVNGEKYTITGIENAPDGSAGVFVVARMRRRER